MNIFMDLCLGNLNIIKFDNLSKKYSALEEIKLQGCFLIQSCILRGGRLPPCHAPFSELQSPAIFNGSCVSINL